MRLGKQRAQGRDFVVARPLAHAEAGNREDTAHGAAEKKRAGMADFGGTEVTDPGARHIAQHPVAGNPGDAASLDRGREPAPTDQREQVCPPEGQF